MHAIHHTDAIVIRSEPSGEANKRVWLFTREFGLIIAMVQGVRKPLAKLQGHVTDYSIIFADLIRGKSTWRLISSQVQSVPLKGNIRQPLARAYVRTIAFLERFLVGEGMHEELFNHISDVAQMVQKGGVEPRALDALSLWKILALLGYIAVDEKDEELYELPFEQAVSLVDDVRIKMLIKDATNAITSSHL
jgi:recombinational DNA repair protein (RecF pathway)